MCDIVLTWRIAPWQILAANPVGTLPEREAILVRFRGLPRAWHGNNCLGAGNMGAGSAFLEILFFGMIAAFLFLRLRSVLGKRMGHERDPNARPDQIARRQAGAPDAEGKRAKDSKATDDNVIAMPAPRLAATDPVARGIAEIQSADRSFDPEAFVIGARTAFELIINAFANGDRDTLRSLTSDDVFNVLEGEMRRREDAGETLEATLVGIRDVRIIEAGVHGSQAMVTLKIESEQIKVVRDGEGHAIQGQHGLIEQATDIWTFSRDVPSKDPNWALTEIRDASAPA